MGGDFYVAVIGPVLGKFFLAAFDFFANKFSKIGKFTIFHTVTTA